MKEYPIIDYLGLMKPESNYIDVSDMDFASLYTELISSLPMFNEKTGRIDNSKNKFFGNFINKK